jgi:hypothetical protein
MKYQSNLRSSDLPGWQRSATVKALSAVTGRDGFRVAQDLYGDEGARAVLKASVAPASTDGWGGSLTGTRVGNFLRSLRPRSAAAQLIDRAARYSFEGVNSVSLPRLSADFPAPAWISEGGAIPVYQGSFASVLLGPPKKLAAMAGLTNEMAAMSAEDAEQTIRILLEDAAAKALDASLFSDAAASAVRPAGLLNGVTAIGATAGGGVNAMVGDLRNLVGALSDAGGGSDVMIFAHPRQATVLKLQASPGFDTPVIGTTALAAGTIVAVEVGAFASGFGADPDIQVAENAAVHLEDANALQLADGGTVASPVRSSFQNDTHVLRLILRAAWAVRQPGAVQVVQSATF